MGMYFADADSLSSHHRRQRRVVWAMMYIIVCTRRIVSNVTIFIERRWVWNDEIFALYKVRKSLACWI